MTEDVVLVSASVETYQERNCVHVETGMWPLDCGPISHAHLWGARLVNRCTWVGSNNWTGTEKGVFLCTLDITTIGGMGLKRFESISG